MELLSGKPTSFHFNPFAGVEHEDIAEILVPRFDASSLVGDIEKGDPRIVELVGKKGRGKTTHLLFLQQQLPQYPIFLLNKGANLEEILHHPSPVVFIDSMHHLNLFQRQQVFRKKDIVVLTTHWTKSWEYALSGKPMHRIRFKGLTFAALKNMIHKRLMLAKKGNFDKIRLNDISIRALIKKHKDDHRAIMNELFDRFQEL